MNTTALVWALWIIAGGNPHSGSLIDGRPAAYFQSAEDCVAVQKVLVEQFKGLAGRTKCIQARYVR